MNAWRWINTGESEAAWNMAFDEALLEVAANDSTPTLRLYGWTEPAATFGYFQHYSEIAAWTKLRPLIRRPTGGGLVPHDADWTYSIVIPPTNAWYDLRAVESYRRVHEWIAAALQSIGMAAELASHARKEIPGQCFAGAERFDLLFNGRKIAGAAQRRSRDGLLIQGSIQPGEFQTQRSRFEAAMLEVSKADWTLFTPGASFHARVADLAAAKYSRDAHNQRR
jgi:lipoyl(octanoyl) transferase